MLCVQNTFRENICFAVLRHLVAACKKDTHQRPIQKVISILRVRVAVQNLSAGEHFRHLSDASEEEVPEWLSQLDRLYIEMQNVSCREDLLGPWHPDNSISSVRREYYTASKRCLPTQWRCVCKAAR